MCGTLINCGRYLFVMSFGIAESHNNINVLQLSSVFARLVECHALKCNYEISGHQYPKWYHLAGGINSR
jgi:hypothetical protein